LRLVRNYISSISSFVRLRKLYLGDWLAVAVRDSQTVLVVCAGVHSSGSTWLFNAVADLLRSTVTNVPSSLDRPVTSDMAEAGVAQLFAESVDAFPEFAEFPQYLVVKTHVAENSLLFLARFAAGPILISVREPRDAVASLMVRFDMPFEDALADVVGAAKRSIALLQISTPLVLRYEDRFFERKETVAKLADFLGITVSRATILRIWRSLSPESVMSKIGQLFEQGMFGLEANPNWYDPTTHWHPRHIGQGKIGIFHDVLSARQQALVVLSTQEFCHKFGYPTELPRLFSPSLLNKERPYLIGQQVFFNQQNDSTKYLSTGWSKVDAKQIWAIGQRSEIILDLGELPLQPNEYELRIMLSLFKTQEMAGYPLSVILNGVPLGKRLILTTTTLQFTVSRTLLESQQPTVITLVQSEVARRSEYSPDATGTGLIAIGLRSFEIAGAVEGALISNDMLDKRASE
jgi:hypothetical protein